MHFDSYPTAILPSHWTYINHLHKSYKIKSLHITDICIALLPYACISLYSQAHTMLLLYIFHISHALVISYIPLTCIPFTHHYMYTTISHDSISHIIANSHSHHTHHMPNSKPYHAQMHDHTICHLCPQHTII